MGTFHLQTNIDGLLRNNTPKKLGNLFCMNGNEVVKELKRLKSLGHKLLPSQGCKHFDPFEKGCECGYYDENGNRIN